MSSYITLGICRQLIVIFANLLVLEFFRETEPVRCVCVCIYIYRKRFILRN